MADTSNLSQFLTDVADAIRTKKETSEQIPAENFDSEILSIEGGIDTSDATATVNDILNPKTAYVNGQKLQGQIIPVYKRLTDIWSEHTINVSFITNATFIYVQELNIYIQFSGANANIIGQNGNVISTSTLNISGSISYVDYKVINNHIILAMITLVSSDNKNLYYFELTNNSFISLADAKAINGYDWGQGQFALKFDSDSDTLAVFVRNRSNGWRMWLSVITYDTNCTIDYLIDSASVFAGEIDFKFIKWLNTDTIVLNAIDYAKTGVVRLTIDKALSSNNVSGKHIWFDIHKSAYACKIEQSSSILSYCAYTYPFTFSNALFSIDTGLSNWLNVYVIDDVCVCYGKTKIKVYAITNDAFELMYEYESKSTTATTVAPLVYVSKHTFSNQLTNQIYSLVHTIDVSDIITTMTRNDVVYIDTSDADAIVSNLENGKTAYVDGQKITGTIEVLPAGERVDLPYNGSSASNVDQVIIAGIVMNKKLILENNSWPQVKIPYSDLVGASGVRETDIAYGKSILGVMGTANFDLEGVVSYQDEESLLADTSRSVNTVGLVQQYVGGEFNGESITGLINLFFPEQITLHEAPTTNYSIPLYYINDTGDGAGMGPMSYVYINVPSEYEPRYNIMIGDSMGVNTPQNWYSEDGINFVADNGSRIENAGDTTWYVEYAYQDDPDKCRLYIQDIVHTLEFGTPKVYNWSGTEWIEYGNTGPISQEEFDTAVDTTEQILGTE